MKKLHAILVGGASLGLLASFLQMLEKLELVKNAQAVLPCNINAVFSCTNVLNSWQSSFFGFPNALLCIVFFALVLGVGLAGLSGGAMARSLRLTMQGISLFFLGFGLWFLEQSTFRIGALCIFCILCFVALLAINAAWMRLNSQELPIGRGGRDRLRRAIAGGYDIVVWIFIALVVAAAMILRFL